MKEMEFLNNLAAKKIDTWHVENADGFLRHYEKFNNLKIRKKGEIELDDYILVQWCSGGTSGSRFISGEDMPSFNYLNIAIGILCPELTYLEYVEKIEPLIQTDTLKEYEYYGSEMVYSCRKIQLRKLWDKFHD